MKTQTIRLLDVFVIGPVMVAAGRRLQKDAPSNLGSALIFFGVATIVYNGMNYIEEEKLHGTSR
jgi:hypothetical protein